MAINKYRGIPNGNGTETIGGVKEAKLSAPPFHVELKEEEVGRPHEGSYKEIDYAEHQVEAQRRYVPDPLATQIGDRQRAGMSQELLERVPEPVINVENGSSSL